MEPTTVYEKLIRIPFLFEFHIIIEDRFPDDLKEQNRYKYKTIVDVKFLWFSFTLIVRSLKIGFLKVNGKEIVI